MSVISSFLANITIRAKLTLLVGIALLALLASSFVGYVGMGVINEMLSGLYEREMRPIILITRVQNDVMAMRVYAYRYIAESDTKVMQDVAGKITASQQKLNEDWTAYSKMPFPENLHTLEYKNKLMEKSSAVAESLPKWLDAMDRLKEIVAPNTAEANASGLKYMSEIIVPIGNRMIDTVNDIVGLNAEAAEVLYHISDKEAASALHSMLFCAAIAIVFLVLFGWLMASGILSSVRTVQHGLGLIRAGDFSHSIRSQGRDEMAQMLYSLENTRSQLQATFKDVIASTVQVAEASTELAGSAQEISVGIQAQSDATTNAAAAIEQLTVSIDNVSQNANLASERAREAGTLAGEGNQSVHRATSEVTQVNETVTKSASDVELLAEQAQQIGSIANVIKDVADQTNLLALNAAIEAARAGEQGRGFAVVADEVRKLAERTTSSAQEISMTIARIQEKVGETVEGMRQMRTVVSGVVETAGAASTSIEQVRGSADVVLNAVQEIATSLGEQRAASNEIAQRVEQVAQQSAGNSASVKMVTEAATNLSNISKSLKSSIERFKI